MNIALWALFAVVEAVVKLVIGRMMARGSGLVEDDAAQIAVIGATLEYKLDAAREAVINAVGDRPENL